MCFENRSEDLLKSLQAEERVLYFLKFGEQVEESVINNLNLNNYNLLSEYMSSKKIDKVTVDWEDYFSLLSNFKRYSFKKKNSGVSPTQIQTEVEVLFKRKQSNQLELTQEDLKNLKDKKVTEVFADEVVGSSKELQALQNGAHFLYAGIKEGSERHLNRFKRDTKISDENFNWLKRKIRDSRNRSMWLKMYQQNMRVWTSVFIQQHKKYPESPNELIDYLRSVNY